MRFWLFERVWYISAFAKPHRRLGSETLRVFACNPCYTVSCPPHVRTITQSKTDLEKPEFLRDLTQWLVTEQPICVAVNATDELEGYPLAMYIFENTSQVVFSIGDTESQPALTAQARPQDGEIFGEFPPRRQLRKFTNFPLVTPSPAPVFQSYFDPSYLAKQAESMDLAGASPASKDFIAAVGDASLRGYCVEIANYLADAASADSSVNPRRGKGGRTSLYGIQRPPIEVRRTIDDAARRDGAQSKLVFDCCFLHSVSAVAPRIVHPSHRMARRSCAALAT